MPDLLSAVERNILSRQLLREGERVLVGVSGGLDSMVLLRVLHELSSKHGWFLRVDHMNHGLRGRSSDADERLVRLACASLKLPVTLKRVDVAALAARKKISIEMAAREVRHAFFAQTALRHRMSCVALAHHADDQVELFFLRLLRGSGSEGLGGMRWSSPSPAEPAVRLVRPLLDQPKSALAAYAEMIRLRYREDASNATPDFLRNRIRIDLLPRLKRKYQPALTRTILRVMDILGTESEFVAQAARDLASRRNRPQFSDWPVALQRRWLQQQLAEAFITVDFERLEALRCHPGNPLTIAPGMTAACEPDGVLHVRRMEQTGPDFRNDTVKVDISARQGRILFGGCWLSWRRETVRRFSLPQPELGMEVFDVDVVGDKIELRHWRPGDRFQPIGMTSALKLQDLFTNEKVLRKRRHELILGVTEQDEVFWVEGLRISERFKLTKGSKCRLVWRWERP